MTELYDLLPRVYQRRDAEAGYALKGLLAVMEEQRQILSDAFAQMRSGLSTYLGLDEDGPPVGPGARPGDQFSRLQFVEHARDVRCPRDEPRGEAQGRDRLGVGRP